MRVHGYNIRVPRDLRGRVIFGSTTDRRHESAGGMKIKGMHGAQGGGGLRLREHMGKTRGTQHSYRRIHDSIRTIPRWSAF